MVRVWRLLAVNRPGSDPPIAPRQMVGRQMFCVKNISIMFPERPLSGHYLHEIRHRAGGDSAKKSLHNPVRRRVVMGREHLVSSDR